MKICEFFRNQFNEAKCNAKWFDEDSQYIVKDLGYEYGSFKWFKELSKRYFGGGFQYEYKAAGITTEQLNDAKQSGYMKHSYSQSYEALKLNQTDWYGLTEKGLKALYKAYEGQW